MKLVYEILFNKYGQGIISSETLVQYFLDADRKEQLEYFDYLLFIIAQSKPIDEDVETAINNSKLKPTYTSCVILRKGVDSNNLKKITLLPDNESLKSFRLLLELFKVAYSRKFAVQKNAPNKWWYWDLSDSTIEDLIYKKFS